MVPLPLSSIGGDGLELADRIVGAVVQGVIVDQLADGALAVGDGVDQGLQLIQGEDGFVVEGGVVDKQADGALAGGERIGAWC